MRLCKECSKYREDRHFGASRYCKFCNNKKWQKVQRNELINTLNKNFDGNMKKVWSYLTKNFYEIKKTTTR